MHRFLKFLITKSLDCLSLYSNLFLAADNPDLVIANEMYELSNTEKKLGGRVAN